MQEIPSNRIARGTHCPASVGVLPQRIVEAKAVPAWRPPPDQGRICAKTAQRLFPGMTD